MARTSTRSTSIRRSDPGSTWKKLFEMAVPALITAVAGYTGALIISPDQLYRKLFWPDPDRYLGHWSGKVGGRSAQMNITRQFVYPNGHSVHVEGTLQLSTSSEKINISGDADSRLMIAGRIDADHVLNIALERDNPEIRSPNERYTRLEAPKGEAAATKCPAHESLAQVSAGYACPALAGPTYFFR